MKTKELYRIAVACQEVGLARSTVRSAIERGEIKAHQTGCGLPLVSLHDVRLWAARSHERKVGRPPLK